MLEALHLVRLTEMIGGCWALQELGCSGDINITAGSTEGVALHGCFEPRPVGSEMSVVLGFERPCVSPEAP